MDCNHLPVQWPSSPGWTMHHPLPGFQAAEDQNAKLPLLQQHREKDPFSNSEGKTQRWEKPLLKVEKETSKSPIWMLGHVRGPPQNVKHDLPMLHTLLEYGGIVWPRLGGAILSTSSELQYVTDIFLRKRPPWYDIDMKLLQALFKSLVPGRSEELISATQSCFLQN